MRVAYLDCFSGISGNMMLGALLDAGLELAKLEAELALLRVDGFRLEVNRVQRNGLTGLHVEVLTEERGVARHLHHIEEIIENSNLVPAVKAKSVAVFRRLAQAEASVHGEPVEHVHFHEVGALDAIVDIVGSVAGLWLLGVEQVYSSPVHIGRGTVECAHGVLPVPAPATAYLLQGVPVYGRDVDSELVTPTGAALLTTLASGYGAAPPMRVDHIGYGAGTRILPLPNLLRISIGEALGNADGYEHDSAIVVETNIDDMNPQLYEHVMNRLFAAGALDVYLTPIQMKRNRPGTLLSILVSDEHLGEVIEVVFAETTAIGVRTCPTHRWKLGREQMLVQTRFGEIGVKVARRGERVFNLAPEYRECQAAAERHQVPVKEVCREALAAAWAQSGQEKQDYGVT
jgi:pyridinium-3,5-bisthiocarboxylic acid mononucleotide nickel chelatase